LDIFRRNYVLGFIIRRVLWVIPVLLVISMITFVLMHSIPGNPFDQEMDKPLHPEVLKRLMEFYQLDDPLYKQYLRYLGDVLRGDFGPSYGYRNRTVNQLIASGFPISMQLGLLGLSLGMAVGIPLGVVSALKQNTAVDYTAMFFAISGVSVPAMTSGPLLIWIFALKLGWLPVARWGSIQQAIMPAIVLGIGPAAILARLTRASMLQVIREDYIRTARAKGVSERRVTVRHALRNALIPVVTAIGPMFAGAITGSVVVEQIFAIPGMGNYFVAGVAGRDYPVIMGMTLLYAVILVLANLLVDIAYSWVDPRIRFERQ
jgi:oligopeptide transport system permease protein